MKIVKVDSNTLSEYLEELMPFFLDVFTTGYYEQYLNPEEMKKYVISIFESGGYGFFAFEGEELIGFIMVVGFEDKDSVGFTMAGSLASSEDLEDAKDAVDSNMTLCILELGVKEGYRGKGIGTKLVEEVINSTGQTKYSQILVRTIPDNQVSMQLYLTHGFKESKLTQVSCVKKDRSGTFEQTRQYLIKAL